MMNLKRLTAMIFLTSLLITALNGIPSPRWIPANLPAESNAIRQAYSPGFEPSRADSAHGFDVQKYEITLNINQQTHQISGFVHATVIAEENLSSIAYNLESLSVLSVQVNGANSTFTHSAGLVNIPLNVSTGQTFTTTVYYSGVPVLTPNPYHIGMIFSNNTVFTISDPDAARYWWPCYDHPWDKAIVDLHITMRSDWKVAANGIRQSIVDNGNGTSTTHWLGENPMTTYLVCITAGPYVEIDQTAGNGSIPIKNFVMQSQYNNALFDLNELPQMVDYFSTLFGPYPFEKYGNAVVSMSTYGAMEHQTMTTLGNFIINGQGTYKLIIAHELAHQWYGNAVSFLDFKDVWLSEGFATYSEHLWTDKTLGWQASVDYVRTSYHDYYKSWESNYGQAPAIYNPSFLNYFSPPSYEKAASVLHMLRYKIGNPNFIQLLRNWFSTYQDGNAITEEFESMAESISGQNLDQFFDQWIYGTGIPSLEYSAWIATDDPRGNLKIIAKSTSPTSTIFHLDVPFGIHSDSLRVQASPAGHANYFNVGYTMDEDPHTTPIVANRNDWALLRTITFKKPELTQCLPSNNAVMISWNEFNVPGVSAYNVYRLNPVYPDHWFRINTTPVMGLSFTDIYVDNGQTYQYCVRAIGPENTESYSSNILIATPLFFSFENDILVVDETRDGNGANISPDDNMCDQFYSSVLADIAQDADIDSWDCVQQSAPPLQTLGSYKVVLWHSDDFNQINLVNSLDQLSAYLLGGGHLIISGWKAPSVFTPSFIQNFLPGVQLVYDSAASLISAQSGVYSDLYVDTSKLSPSWNNMLPMIYTFPGAQSVLHTAEMSASANGNGNPIVISQDNLVLFGMPLYFMLPDGVRNVLSQVIAPMLIPSDTDDTDITPHQAQLSAYPNPFNPSTTISFSLPNTSDVELSIYNLRGQLIREYKQAKLSKGSHSIVFDGLDQNGNTLSSGIYQLKLIYDSGTLSRRISMIK